MKGRIVTVLLSFLLFAWSAEGLYANDAKAQAKSLYESVRGKFSTPQALNQNFVAPSLGNGTLSTFDNSKTFSANISCPSSTKFLEIIMQPQSNGNVNFNVYFDSNFDGKVDKVQYFTGISGICGNGYVKCADPRNWFDCRMYKVSYDGSSFVETETSLFSLSSCFAVTNMYGNLVAKDYILSAFGGVLVGALQQYNPYFAVSKVQTQDVVITYYGQDRQRCSYNQAGAGSSSSESPAIYFGGAYTGDFSMAYRLSEVGQSLKQSSPFTGTFANLYSNMTERSCYVRRIVDSRTYDWNTFFRTSGGRSAAGCWAGSGYSLCGPACIQYVVYLEECALDSVSSIIDIPRQSFFKYLSEVRFWTCTAQYGCGCFDDDNSGVFYVNNNYVGGFCGCDVDSYQDFPVSVRGDLLLPGQNTIQIKLTGVAGGKKHCCGCRPVYISFLFKDALPQCYVTGERIEDQCESLRQDPKCKLKDVFVDGTPVVLNGINTGLIPLTTCQEICGEIFCYNDWEIRKVYLCEENPPQPDFTRAQKILSTINYDGSKLTFDDVRKEGGVWKDYPGQSFWLNLERGEACPKVCKVRIQSVEEVTNEVGNQGPVSNIRTGPKILYDYRECVDNRCPFDPSAGEVMVQNCGCLTDFNDVLVSLQAVRLASQDLICSSGIQKTLPGW